MLFDFRRGERLEIDGAVFTVDRPLAKGYRLVGLADGFERDVSSEEFKLLLASGRFRRLEPADGSPPVQFIALNDRDRAEALRRSAYVDGIRGELGDPPYRDEDLVKALVTVHGKVGGEGAPPALSTIRKYLALARNGGGDIAALAPDHRSKGLRGRQCGREVGMVVDRVFDEYVMTTDPTTTCGVFNEVEKRIAEENAISPEMLMKGPSRASLYRWIGGINPADKLLAQKGQRARDRVFGMVMPGPVEPLPYGAIEIDHGRCDAEVMDENGNVIGRPWLAMGIDRASTAIPGYVLTWHDPGTMSVLALLKHIIMPKTYLRGLFPRVDNDWPCAGIPRTIVCDNGSDFHSRSFQEACSALGTGIDYCPTGDPAKKGMIERAFGTLNTGMFNMLPGATFTLYKRRPQDKKPSGARISLAALNECLHRFIVDVHMQRVHRTRRQAPIVMWNELTERHPVRMPRSLEHVDILCREEDTRVVGRQGIELNGYLYQSERLNHLMIALGGPGHPVSVRWTKADLGSVYVLDAARAEFFEVPCVSDTAIGQSLAEQRAVIDALATHAPGASAASVRDAHATLVRDARAVIADAKAGKRAKRKAARTLLPTRTPDAMETVSGKFGPNASAHPQAKRSRGRAAAVIDEGEDIAAVAASIGMTTKRMK